MLTRIQKLLGKTRAAVTGTPDYVRRYQRLSGSLGQPQSPAYDIVYVMPPKHVQGWILDAICREIDRHVKGRTAFVELKEKLPPARAYFYSHYGYMRGTVLDQPHVLHGRNILFYTHPRELWYPQSELIHVMNMADKVVSMSSKFVPDLIRQGVRPELIEVALVGADPSMFKPHQRGNGKVGFCSSYLPRKGGERILELVRSMPQTEFVLCGKKWEDWPRFTELISLSNFEYVQLPYADYPGFYDSLDVFVSVSELEGGPVPLIESAMCNVVPVCSNTGHAPDIIKHGVNGFLFDPKCPVNHISELIQQAQHTDTNVRATVEHLTWERFSQQIQRSACLRESTSLPTLADAA